MRFWKILLEPSRGMGDDGFHRTGFGKQVTRAGNDLDCVGRLQAAGGIFIQLDYADVGTADDEQRRRADQGQGVIGKIGAPAA